MTVVEGAVGESEIVASVPENMRQRTALLKIADELVKEIASPSGKASGRGKTTLFRSAVKTVQEWAQHPNVGIQDLKPLLADGRHRHHAVIAILDACDFITSDSARCARLANPRAVLDTSNVDFTTTLSEIERATKSEVSHAACHTRHEALTAGALDKQSRVVRWVRNFQLGWTIPYWRDGAWARYEPDFVAVLDDGTNLIIECKQVWNNKANSTVEYTKEHWIPSIAGTTELPDSLRKWAYAVIDDPNSVNYQLDCAISLALTQ